MKKENLLYCLLAVLALIVPFVIQNNYYLHVINLAGIYTLITLGLNLLSGYTGQVSMGQAGFFAIGTYTSALLALNFDMPFLVTLPIAFIVAGIFGLIIAIPAMRLSGAYLVLATVGFGEIVRLVILNWTPVTKGAAGLTGIPMVKLFGFKILSEQSFYYFILCFVVLGIYIAYKLAHSKIGRTFSAIREDELAAQAMGVPVNKYKISAFVISAIYAGVAGAIYGVFSGVASPDNFTFDDSVAFLCMSVIGGNRSITGAIIGAFVLTIMSEALRALQMYRLIFYGAILIFTVIYMPQGLVGLFSYLKEKFMPQNKATDGGAV